jgi:hypothetical protein
VVLLLGVAIVSDSAKDTSYCRSVVEELLRMNPKRKNSTKRKEARVQENFRYGTKPTNVVLGRICPFENWWTD